MEPLVSVIVPVYGTEAFLEQCADSILQQTWRNLEIILVDDESPDKSPEICDMYAAKDSRVRVIHRKNGGVSAARNAGLDAAGGDYIAFVDSDDWISPDMIEVLVNACEQNDTDLAFCRIIHVIQGKEEELRPQQPEVITGEDLLKDLLTHRRGGFNIYNKLYRAGLFREIRFPEGERYEDEAVLYPLIRQARSVSYTGTANYYYRIHTESYCNRSFQFNKARMKRARVQALEKELKEHNPQLLPLLKYHAAFAEFELLRFYLEYGGDISEEEERSLREGFEKSFPDLLYILQENKRVMDRREAVWMRLGLWDGIRETRERAISLEQAFPEELRQAIDLEHDGFTQRMFRPEEYAKIEKELKKAVSTEEKLERLKKENETLRSQVRELSESRSYRIGRAVTRVPGLLRGLLRRRGS